MREQKYADILKKYEELEEDSKDEKLSMTRELKFKELHEQVRDSISSGVDDAVDEDNSNLKKVNDTSSELKKNADKLEQNIKNVSKEGKDSNNGISKKKDNEDDIYLTTSFKPPKFSQNVKKGANVLLVMILVLGVFLAIGYFGLYPIYKKYVSSRPKMIFDSSVDYVSDYLKNVIEKNVSESDVFYFDTNFKIKSNIDGFDELYNDTYGIEFGVDPARKTSFSSIYVKDNNKRYASRIIEKEDKVYYNYSTSDKYLEIDAEEQEDYYDEWRELLDSSADISREDLIYLIDKESEIIKELIENDLVSQEKDEIDVSGETIPVVRNTYKIEKDEYKRLDKKYIDKIKEDLKLLEILAKLEDMTVSEYKDTLEEDSEEYELIFNIYTVDGTKVVGFDLEENGFRNLYYYSNEGNFEFHINLSDDECVSGNDCVADEQFIIDLTGNKKDTYTEVEVKYNGKKVATLNVKSFTDAKIDFEYVVEYEEQEINGDVLLFIDYNKQTINLDFSAKVEEEYIDLNFYICEKTEEEFGNIDEKNIVKYSDELYLEESKKFAEIIDKEGVYDSFDLWMGICNKVADLIVASENSENDQEENPPSQVA